MTAWRVFADDTLVLTMRDGPGPLTSTAPRAPGSPPAEHPFVSVDARDADHEGRVRACLVAARDADDFRARLRAAGYRVEAATGPTSGE